MRFRILLVAALFLVGCGKGGDDDDDTSSPTPTPTAGTITANATGVTGSDGLILLGSVYDVGGSPQAGLAGMCAGISGDPADVTGVFAEYNGGGNPCDLGNTFTFDPGDYEFFFGTFVPGQMTPQECAEGTVNVNGDTDLTVPALGVCP